MSGQAFGPIIGGALNSVFGFRSIFWFLFVMAAIVLLALLTFLPETQRHIAGNGSVRLSGFHKPLIYSFKEPHAWKQGGKGYLAQPTSRRTLRSSLEPLRHVVTKDIACLLIWGAVAYTAWSMVTSSTTTALLRGYPFLNEWQLGLCFLPNGLGCVAGSLVTGRLLDRQFKELEAEYRSRSDLNAEANISNRSDLPVVRSRMKLMPHFSIGLILCLGFYGPSFEFNDLRKHYMGNLAAPLLLQFSIAFTATAIFNINSTLLIDCFQKQPASATALNNLFRCLVGAAGVSVIQSMIDLIKIMKAFLVVTGLVALFTPIVWAEWKWGDRWRRQREYESDQQHLVS
jgi:MFS family permease